MDRFLKRVHESSSASSSVDTQSPSKRPSPAAKQGKVSAAVRVAEFGSDKFYADGGKLFCNVVVEHTRKSTVQRHLSRKVGLSFQLLIKDGFQLNIRAYILVYWQVV